MSQRDQVIDVMEKLGGVATFGELNQKVDVRNWKAKQPFANIRRIVQEEEYFFKIKAGLWGLNTHRGKLGHLIRKNRPAEETEKLDHSYYQGLLLEIGNIQKFQTFAPNQDKNKPFLPPAPGDKRTPLTLGKLRTLQRMHSFTYQTTVNRACMIDVVWFNRRNMPYAAFEVEHSTDFTNALSKYIALQDFNTQFYVVASESKSRQFADKISRDEYVPIQKRVKFIDYEKLATWHGHSMQADRLGEMP